jgi:hypothetical protein
MLKGYPEKMVDGPPQNLKSGKNEACLIMEFTHRIFSK